MYYRNRLLELREKAERCFLRYANTLDPFWLASAYDYLDMVNEYRKLVYKGGHA